MTIDKISLQVLYPTGAYSNIRPSMEATLEAGDTPEQCLTQLKERLDNWFWEAHPELSQQRGTQVRDIVGENQIQVPEKTLMEELEACETFADIQSFRFTVKNEEEKAVYERKLTELSPKN